MTVNTLYIVSSVTPCLPFIDSQFQDVRDKPTVTDSRQILRNEERIQIDGAASFHKFNMFVRFFCQNRVASQFIQQYHSTDQRGPLVLVLWPSITLTKTQFRHFHNASAQLGSSTKVNSLAVILRRQLPPFRFLFQENATELFPHKVNRPEPNPKNSVHLEDLPQLFEKFAADLEKFQECLDEFREVVDDAIKSAIDSWVTDLQVRESQPSFNNCLLMISCSIGLAV